MRGLGRLQTLQVINILRETFRMVSPWKYGKEKESIYSTKSKRCFQIETLHDQKLYVSGQKQKRP